MKKSQRRSSVTSITSIIPATGIPGRTYHLVDLENLVGGAYAGADQSRAILDSYAQASRHRIGDGGIVCANRFLTKHVFMNLPTGLSFRIAPVGPDGAENRLLAEIPERVVFTRYDRLCVGSGDWRFAPLLRRARDAGITVDVVALSGAAASRLTDIADSVTYIGAGQMKAAS